jgi:DMSO/TMAO reductase YedYZ molybdopterin-dependent catalytic subunit
MRSDDVSVGRRVFLGLLDLGGAGIVHGAKVQRMVGTACSQRVTGSASNQLPETSPSSAVPTYRLEVTGLVDRPKICSLDDLKAIDRTALVGDFHCVTGWSVPAVHWEGVTLLDILADGGVRPGGNALSFESYDGIDAESLTPRAGPPFRRDCRLPDARRCGDR